MKASWKDTVKTNDFGAYSVQIKGVDYLGALDELVWPVELEKRGFAMQELHPGSKTGRGLTFADQHPGESHPGDAESVAQAKETIKNALEFGALFARKFVGTKGQVAALQQNLKARTHPDKLFAWMHLKARIPPQEQLMQSADQDAALEEATDAADATYATDATLEEPTNATDATDVTYATDIEEGSATDATDDATYATDIEEGDGSPTDATDDLYATDIEEGEVSATDATEN